MGGVGVGKTHLMKAFSQNPRQGFVVKNVEQIGLEFKQKDSDEKTIDKYSTISYHSGHNLLTGKNDRSFCFDDLGTEENINNFGNIASVMWLVFSRCYEKNITIHCTTNLSPEAMLQRYGERFLDRFAQMFNVIEFHPETLSRRK